MPLFFLFLSFFRYDRSSHLTFTPFSPQERKEGGTGGKKINGRKALVVVYVLHWRRSHPDSGSAESSLLGHDLN